jgi:hypothetical protein
VLGSCVSGGRRDVYDLTVADAHEFTASGVIVHNCIWAMIHLAGSNQGDWGTVYGFTDCTGCGARVNYQKDKRCGNCGKDVVPPAPKHAGGRPAQVPWSAAYLKTCGKCEKTYSPHERTCPHCEASPEAYMAKVAAFTGGQTGRHGYTGRDILRGRKL